MSTAHLDQSGKPVGAFRRLYRGETSFDFVGRRKVWFSISAVIIILGLVSLGVRGLNLGIDFKGGQSWTVEAKGVTVDQATAAVSGTITPSSVQVVGGRTIVVEAQVKGTPAQQEKVRNEVIAELAKLAHTTENQVSFSSVGPTWGGEVSNRALIALLVFFGVVAVYISIRFEPKMALAAFLAMLHDLLITVGVYSIFNFQVTPDTVVAILTILGYSLYDTVVVFDRVSDNAKVLGATGRMTYSDMVNLSMNQTLARSINTSLVAILPVLSVLLVGAEILGATTLQDYGLALFVGLLSGAYSSIFIASPLLAVLKEREPRYRDLRQRLAARGDATAILTPAGAAKMSSERSASASAGARPKGPTTIAPRPRKQKRR